MRDSVLYTGVIFRNAGTFGTHTLYYAVEACPLLARQTLSSEFTLTRIFIKLFWTGSSKVANECQVSFGFLPAKSQILIRTASFLQKFTVSENSLCMLFANDARRQLHNIFCNVVVVIC